MFRLCPLTAFLPLTLHVLLIKILAHLSGVPHRRFMFEKICLVFGHNENPRKKAIPRDIHIYYKLIDKPLKNKNNALAEQAGAIKK